MTAPVSNAFEEAASKPPKSKPKYPPPLSLRLTPEERERLERDAGQLTLSAYIRLCLFGDDVPKHRTRGTKVIKDHEALALVLHHFMHSNIANNLNQLAKATHMGTLPIDDETASCLREACAEVAEMRAVLVQALGQSGRRK